MKLVVGTYNLSVGAVTHRPDAVVKDILGMLKVADVVGLQEAGEAGHVLKAVEKAGYHVYYGEGQDSQAATPIVTRKPFKRHRSFFLTKPTNVGDAGAGPATIKEKWLNVVWLRFYGRKSIFGNMHTTPSIYIRIRRWLAERQCDRAGDALAPLSGLKFVTGDFNSTPTDAVRDGLEHRNLVSSQLVAGPKNTEDDRSIDDIYYKKSRAVRLVKTWVEDGASDHRKYFAEFDIKPSLAWRIKHRK